MKLPIKDAAFLLPKKSIDLEKWSVIACDQHTSDISYWEKLAVFVGESPSTLSFIFPEVYLHKGDDEKRSSDIALATKAALEQDIFDEYSGMVSVTRTVSNGKQRKGILLCVDLEDYSFIKGEKPLIRASEGTVLERIPPRVAVREKCALESPHIMVLYDDPDFTVQKAVDGNADKGLYDFELNFGGGRLRGEKIADTQKVLTAFENLLAFSKDKYGEELLFAVGDGNHSLAAAKQVYENAKAKGEGEKCRYALCEAVNLYDEALEFEPIHRIVFAKDKEGKEFSIEIKKKMPRDSIAAVSFVDALAKENGFEVDYIHGEKHTKDLAKKLDAVPVLLQAMDKSEFFPYIIKNGSLPKKTFSMGEAEDKRYYLECARI
ncbi:MAG: DUF1015 domain-containing protein [Firmicutes bacterium]|nr:DUF1015 domain-containing protein [Bacillota bacterium]